MQRWLTGMQRPPIASVHFLSAMPLPGRRRLAASALWLLAWLVGAARGQARSHSALVGSRLLPSRMAGWKCTDAMGGRRIPVSQRRIPAADEHTCTSIRKEKQRQGGDRAVPAHLPHPFFRTGGGGGGGGGGV